MSNEVKGFFQFHTFNASIAHWVWCKCKFISSVYYLTLQISSELLLEVDKGRKVVSLDFQTAQGINPICSTLRASLSRNIFGSGEEPNIGTTIFLDGIYQLEESQRFKLLLFSR
jgi:hypothetical protein